MRLRGLVRHNRFDRDSSIKLLHLRVLACGQVSAASDSDAMAPPKHRVFRLASHEVLIFFVLALLLALSLVIAPFAAGPAGSPVAVASLPQASNV